MSTEHQATPPPPPPEVKPPGGEDPDTASIESNDDAVATIMRDIACPACGYNLRGLVGPIVGCPECGERCDIPKMVAARWTEPWWKAPGFNTVLMPSVGAAIGLALLVWPGMIAPGEPMMFLSFVAAALSVWGLLLWRAWGVFKKAEGVWLAMLAHVVLVAYAGSLIVMIGSAVALIMQLVELIDEGSGSIAGVVWSGVVLVVCIVMFVLARKGERFIAQRCIKRHLAALGAEQKG